jgi:hypothetical protein
VSCSRPSPTGSASPSEIAATRKGTASWRVVLQSEDTIEPSRQPPSAESGRRAPADKDTCPQTGRGRLPYPRADYLFKQASKAVDPHKTGSTLRQLRTWAASTSNADHTTPSVRRNQRGGC